MSETLQKKLFQRIRVNWLAIIFIAFILLFLIAIDVQFSWKGLVVFFGLAVVANLIRELLVGRMIALKTIAWLGPVWDILLITCVVYFTGGHDSIFGFLYLVPIISVSVMLSAEKGIIFSILSSLLFSTLVMLEFRGIIPFTSIVGDRAYVRIDNVYLVITILLNRFLVFFIVASVSGYLAESLKQKMNEADEVKNEFVSLVSHQLKTPLSIFKLYLEELLSQRLGKINKDQKEYLDEMQHNNENLICLVSDLLDISRMESGKIQFQPEPTCLDHLIKQVVDELHSVATNSGCKLFFINHLTKDCPLVFIDPNKVEQAVVNLISNAIKYSSHEKKKGQVVVEIWQMNKKQAKYLRPKIAEITGRKIIDMVRKAYSKPLFHIQDHQSVKKKQDYLLVKITDNGIGIPEDDQKNIFSKFYRGANVSVHNTEGTGLGLFITKVIIESCKGEIWFESEEGKGTTVYFTIPIEKNKVQKDKKYE